MNKPYFQLDQVSVGYHGKTLIHDIAFSIQKGEIVTLIGPNGSGKSTILKSITRQLQLIHGNVLVEDTNIRSLSYKDLSCKMAVMLTERMKPELMTCYDIVATGRYPYTGRLGRLTEHDEEVVEAAMAAVHASEVGTKDFNAISDGQRQRVLLARAICQEPEILILDEPTSFLDIKHKLELLSILKQMAREKGITVIMSLHEIDLAQKISDKIVCVKGETIFRYGTPSDIFREDTIRELYSIDNGSFDPLFGSIELPKPGGKATTLVLSSCGSGIPVYRKLQQQDIPFIAGVLYENDVDYQLARLLAERCITEKPFCNLSDSTYAAICQAIDEADTIINAGIPIGPGNSRMKDVLEYAQNSGKIRQDSFK